MGETRGQRFRRRVVADALQRGWRWARNHGAIAPGTRAAERFGSFGEASMIAFPATEIYGEAHIHIGAGTLVCPYATLVAGYSPEQTTVPERALVIGDRTVIGIRTGIVAHESIEIGDDVWFGQDIYVTDASHDHTDPDLPIGKQIGDHKPVSIGSGSWIGHGAVILPGSQIGRNVVVAAQAVVRGDVPDHSVVAGVPAKIIQSFVPGEGWTRSDLRALEPERATQRAAGSE